jgi:hypothetical protein
MALKSSCVANSNRSFFARAVAWVLQRAAKLSIGCRSYGFNYLRDITISSPKVPPRLPAFVASHSSTVHANGNANPDI